MSILAAAIAWTRLVALIGIVLLLLIASYIAKHWDPDAPLGSDDAFDDDAEDDDSTGGHS